MKQIILSALCLSIVLAIFSCAKHLYPTNGETIYKTGKNKNGKKLLDKSKSRITFVKGCKGCHGKNGDGNKDCIIQWSYLSNHQKLSIPYTDSLFFRFIDNDLKSDSSHAETGVHWNMSEQDKKDLLEFLKTL